MRPMPELEIHVLPVAQLVPYANNAKKHPQKQVDEIAASIEAFGNCDPIGVWHNEQGQPEIVEGHGRVLALQKLGIETAPVMFLDHLSDEQRRAYTHVHNQTTLSSDFDYDALVADMDNLNVDWEDFGFESYLYHDMTDEWFERKNRESKTQEGNDEYNEFTEKFEPKKTTDDCYTPELVYDAVAEWVSSEYFVERSKFVRPFYPGGDYEHERYPKGCVVVDNPPFSILVKIIRFYLANDIKFFLFAPTLTLFSGRSLDVCYVAADCDITYENGAKVNTSFITNLDPESVVRTAPALTAAVKNADRISREETAKPINLKYRYPPYVITAAMVSNWSSIGVDFRLAKSSAVQIGALDAQKEYDKAIYGSGFLISEAAKADAEAAKAAEAADRKSVV